MLAHHLEPDKYEVHIALLTQSFCDGFVLPPSARIYCLGGRRARNAIFRLISLARKIRPQVIFLGMAHLAPLVILLRVMLLANTRIIVRQNGAVLSVLAAMKPAILFRPILAIAYRRANLVICQTQSTSDELQRRFHLHGGRLCVLANPVDLEEIHHAENEADHLGASQGYLLAMGRLEQEKGFDLLLDAFAAINRDYPGLRLLIAGSGSCQQELEAQARRLGLEKQVEFLGEVRTPAQLFGGALAFVLSSRKDEMPNAMLEAAAAGLPIIATPSSPGVVDLLAGHAGVRLAPEASATALEEALRKALPEISGPLRFKHEWIEPFRLAPALAAYQEAFDKVLNGCRP
jgi:glycosyltransferase involved in cell wall biosynthesis